MPLSGGFASFVDHAQRVERLKRAVKFDLGEDTRLSHRAAALVGTLDTLTKERTERDFCYSDVQHLWIGRDIDRHVFPYVDGRITPERESEMLAYLLTYWALRGTLDVAEVCATDVGVRQGWRQAPIHVPRSAAMAAVYGRDRVLEGQAAFASLVAPHRVARG